MGNMMRKMLAILVAALSIVWINPVNAVGTIAFSLSQQFDQNGNVLGGCLLYTIQAGTTSTPQNAFKDTALTLPQPNPMACDGFGRLPQFFLADGQIKIRLTDKNNNQIFVQDNILVIGPSSGGGGGGSVDPTTVLATGDFKATYGTGPLTGFVRCNARTIGSATSGASERANADTNALYSFLWAADPNLVVVGGRGANAGADFAANKPLTLPDCRSRTLSGLDDMGNSAAGVLTSVGFGAASVTTLGSKGGGDNFAQTLNMLPTGISSTGNFTSNQSGLINSNNNVTTFSTNAGGATQWLAWATSATVNQTNVTGALSVSSSNTGANAPGGAKNAPSVGPRILITIYLKL